MYIVNGQNTRQSQTASNRMWENILY